MPAESLGQRLDRWRVPELLAKYPGLRLSTDAGESVTIVGDLAFTAEAPGRERIADEYRLRLEVPERFPEEMASAFEVGGRIAVSFHKLRDGSLCLGAPLRLRLTLVQAPTVLGLVERCVIPYLYGHSYYRVHGVLPFGELQHGQDGILDDLMGLFDVDSRGGALGFVRLAALRRRYANKAPCPCGSRRRLGRCHHRRVNRLRDRVGRRWFRLTAHALRGVPAIE